MYAEPKIIPVKQQMELRRWDQFKLFKDGSKNSSIVKNKIVNNACIPVLVLQMINKFEKTNKIKMLYDCFNM